jgi:prevent-host-death family protein
MAELNVGLRELKTHLSAYMRQVKSGRTIVITEHGRAVGRIVPAPKSLDEQLQALLVSGLAEWNGERLPPVEHKPRVRGKKTVSDLVIENRE